MNTASRYLAAGLCAAPMRELWYTMAMKAILCVILPLIVSVAAAATATAGQPWGVAPDGTVWTEHSKMFMDPPTFKFAAVTGATAYASEVFDDFHSVHTVASEGPIVSLEKVWGEIPVGYVTVICRGNGADGKCLGEAGRRTIWKKAAFDPERCPARAMSYGLARTRIMEGYLGLEQTRRLAATGELDLDSYPLNGYPSKMLAAQVVAACEFAKSGTMGENDAKSMLALARKAGDFLIAYSVPAGQPLEYLPRTYHERGSEYGRFKGEQDRIHLVYPAKAGLALVVLHKATEERKYLAAAERIAKTYIRLQEADGTWPMMLDAKTGERYNQNRLMPLEVMLFMEALHDANGDDACRKCADRAFAFLENGPMRNWNWEGQFEDGAKAKVTTHRNLSNFPANMMASYLVRRFPKDPARIAQAEALCRFVEDQFVCWEPPYDHGRSKNEYGREDDGSWSWFCRPTENWCTPCVLEQYICYVPVNASSAKTIGTLLDVWKATGKPAYLEKARALGNSLTWMVEPDGFINTWNVRGVRRNDHRHHTWINCTMETAAALGRLANASDVAR